MSATQMYRKNPDGTREPMDWRDGKTWDEKMEAFDKFPNGRLGSLLSRLGDFGDYIRGVLDGSEEARTSFGRLLAAIIGNRNETRDYSDVVINENPDAPANNRVRNNEERSAVRGAFEGMASELGMTGPQFWNLVSEANTKVRSGEAQSALDVVAARIGVDKDTLIEKGLDNGFTMENGQIRVSDRTMGRTVSQAPEPSSDPWDAKRKAEQQVSRNLTALETEAYTHAASELGVNPAILKKAIRQSGVAAKEADGPQDNDPIAELANRIGKKREDVEKALSHNGFGVEHHNKWKSYAGGGDALAGGYNGISFTPDPAKLYKGVDEKALNWEPPVMGIHPDFADRHGKKLSNGAVEKLSSMAAELQTAGLVGKNQGRVIDREPQGKLVSQAAGLESAQVAQI